MAQWVKPLLVVPASHTGASWSPAFTFSAQLSANVHEKATENGLLGSAWVPVPMNETWEKLLTHGFGFAQLWPRQPFGE